MFRRRTAVAVMLVSLVASNASAQTNPLWHEQKTKNYLSATHELARGARLADAHATESLVDGAVRFIERWKTLRPLPRR